MQQPIQDPPKKNLWKGLIKDEKYTLSYQEFEKQFSDPKELDRLYKGLYEDGDFTLDKDAFINEYFPELKKKEQAQPIPSDVGGKPSSDASPLPLQSELAVKPLVTLPNGTPQPTPFPNPTPTPEPKPVDDFSGLGLIDKVQKASKLGDVNVPLSVTSGGVMQGGLGGSDAYYDETQSQKRKQELEQKKQLKKQIAESGIDPDVADLVLSDLQFVDDAAKQNLEQKLINNPQLGIRTAARLKWRAKLDDEFAKREAQLTAEGKTEEVSKLKTMYQNLGLIGGTKTYQDQRKAVQSVSELIDATSLENRDEIKKILSEEAKFNYGARLAKKEAYKINTLADLDEYETVALEYLSDVDKGRYEAFKGVLIEPKAGQKNDWEFQLGRSEKRKRLREAGLILALDAAKEMAASAKQKGDEENYQKFTIEADNLKNRIDNLYSEFEDAGVYDTLTAAKELIGIGGAGGAVEQVGQTLGAGIVKTGKGVWDLLATPFRSDEERQIDNLRALGLSKQLGLDTYVPQSLSSERTFELTLEPELKEQVWALRNDPNLSYDEKLSQVSSLLSRNRGKWTRTAIEPTANITGKGLLLSTADLGANLIPYIGINAVTGGGASASTARIFASEFGAAALTMYEDYKMYAAENDLPNPDAYAFKATIINGLANAVGGTAAQIRNAAKGLKDRSMRESIARLSDDEILQALRTGEQVSPTALTRMKGLVRNAKQQALPTAKKVADNITEAGKLTGILQTGEALTQLSEGEEIDPQQIVRNFLIGTLNFSLLTTGMNAASLAKFNKTDNVKNAIFEAGKLPKKSKEVADELLAKGKVTQEQHSQIVKNIDLAQKVYDNTPLLNAKGEKLTEKEARELVFLKMQEADLEGVMSKSLPKELQDKVASRLVDIQTKIDEVYKGTFIDNVILDGEKRDTKLSQRIPGLDEQGVPIPKPQVEEGGNVTQSPLEPIAEPEAPQVKGTPEEISQPVELSTDIPTKTSEVSGEQEALRNVAEIPALADVESTAKALSQFRWDNPQVQKITELAPNIYISFEALAEDYHEFKKDGTNKDFVKAVEELIGVKQADTNVTQSVKNEPTLQQPTGEGVTEQVSEPLPQDATKPKAEGSEESLPTSPEPISKAPTDAATPVLEVDAIGEGSMSDRALPPIPPTDKTFKLEGSERQRMRAVADRILGSEVVTDSVKRLVKENGEYDVQTQAEASNLANAIVDELGEQGALEALRQGLVSDAMVQSAIFAKLSEASVLREKSLRESGQIEAANAERNYAADLIIEYAERATNAGKFISQIAFFYKNSPLAIAKAINKANEKRFEQFAKDKDANWQEAFNEFVKTEQGEALMKERVEEELKKERATYRKARDKKVDDAIDGLINDLKGFSTAQILPITPAVVTILKGIKVLYKAGSKAADIVADTMLALEKELGVGNFDKDAVAKKVEAMVKKLDEGVPDRKELTDEEYNALRFKNLTDQITELKQKIAGEKSLEPKAKENKRQLTEEVKALEKERDELRKEVERLRKEQKVGRYSDESRNEAAQKKAKESIAELNRRLRENELETQKAESLNETQETKRLRAERDALRKQLNEAKKEQKVGRYSDQAKNDAFLKRFGKKLEGLEPSQRKEVIKRASREILEKGGLSYSEFRGIIAEVLGQKDLSDAQITQLEALLAKGKAYDAALEELAKNPTKENVAKANKLGLESAEASRDLDAMFNTEASTTELLQTYVKLGLLSLKTVTLNVVQNAMRAAFEDLPRFASKYLLDFTLNFALPKTVGKVVPGMSTSGRKMSLRAAAKGYFSQFARQWGRAAFNFKRGTQSRDIFGEEAQANIISPNQAKKELEQARRGEIFLTPKQKLNRKLRSNILARQHDLISRSLGFGDLPFRGANEGAVAMQIAQLEIGLTSPEHIEAYITAPMQVGKRFVFDKLMAEEEGEITPKRKAMIEKKAEEIAREYLERIAESGKKAVYQQENLISKGSKWVDQALKVKEQDALGTRVAKRAAALIKTATVPFVTFPANYYYANFKLNNPVYTLGEMAYYLAAWEQERRKPNNEARTTKMYNKAMESFSYVATGIAMQVFVQGLVSQGLVTGGNTSEDKAREKVGEATYRKASQFNIGKYLGQDDFWVDVMYLGPLGTVMDTQAIFNDREKEREYKNEELTKMQAILDNMGISFKTSLNTVIGENVNRLAEAIMMREGKVQSIASDLVGKTTGIVTGGTLPWISRSELPFKPQIYDASSWSNSMMNDQVARNILLRKAASMFGKELIPQRDIWGRKIETGGSVADRLMKAGGFVGKSQDDIAFAPIIYEDFLRTQDAMFLPPTIPRKLNVGDEQVALNIEEYDRLAEYIGTARRELVSMLVFSDEDVMGLEDTPYVKLKKDEDKVQRLSKVYQQARNIGMANFVRDFPAFKKAEVIEEEETEEAQEERQRLIKEIDEKINAKAKELKSKTQYDF